MFRSYRMYSATIAPQGEQVVLSQLVGYIFGDCFWSQQAGRLNNVLSAVAFL